MSSGRIGQFTDVTAGKGHGREGEEDRHCLSIPLMRAAKSTISAMAVMDAPVEVLGDKEARLAFAVTWRSANACVPTHCGQEGRVRGIRLGRLRGTDAKRT